VIGDSAYLKDITKQRLLRGFVDGCICSRHRGQRERHQRSAVARRRSRRLRLKRGSLRQHDKFVTEELLHVFCVHDAQHWLNFLPQVQPIRANRLLSRRCRHYLAVGAVNNHVLLKSALGICRGPSQHAQHSVELGRLQRHVTGSHADAREPDPVAVFQSTDCSPLQLITS
jgi:hypothetical protein